MAKYRVTENRLRGMIRESVAEILEGQGWNLFKNRAKDVWNGRYENPDKGDFKNFVKTGNPDGFDEDYYDENGFSTINPKNSQGNPNKRVNRGLRGKAGRAAAGLALSGVNKLGKAWRNWGKNVDDADSKPNPSYKNESKLRGMIREAVKSALNENENVPYEAWSEFLNGREPLFEFEDGIIYVDYDENKGTLCSGGVTNIGFHKDGEVEVPVIDGDFQSALEEVYSQLVCNHEPLEY